MPSLPQAALTPNYIPFSPILNALVLFCHFAGPPVLVFNAIFKIRIIFPNLVFSLKICFCGTLYCVKIYGVDKFAPGIE